MATKGSATVEQDTDAGAAPAPTPKKTKKLAVIGLVVAVAAAGVWFFLFQPSPEPAAPEPGAVISLEAININLADGRYLKLGLALQATVDVAEELDGSKALDLAVAEFSGVPIGELSSPKGRDKAKKELKEAVAEAYEGEVMDVYFTEFVMQ